MKHILTILALLISSYSFSQVVVKVPGPNLSNYVTRPELLDSIKTDYVKPPGYWDHDTLKIYTETDSTLSDNSDTTLPSTKAVRAFASKNGDVDTVGSITSLINYSKAAKIVFVSDSLRGGMFSYITTVLKPDSGTIFNANGKGGGYWRRYYQGNTVNAMWFGAVGDGVTDCTQPIQLAIKAVDKNNGHAGGSVYIPAGSYIISSPITMGDHVDIYGDFWATVLELANGANCNMFTNPSALTTYIKIYNMALQGNDGNNTSGSAFYITSTGFNNSDIYFSHLLIAHFRDNGIYIESGWQYHVESCIIEFIWKSVLCFNPKGTSQTQNIRRVTIQNNNLFATGFNAGYVDSSDAVRFNGSPSRIISGVQIMNNYLQNTNQVGTGNILHISGVDNFNITGNRLEGDPYHTADSTGDIIRIDSSAKFGTVGSNLIGAIRETGSVNTLPVRYGISIFDSSHDITILKSNYANIRLKNIFISSGYNIDTLAVNDLLNTNRATYENKIDLSAKPNFPSVDFIYPGGSSSAGTGIFRAASVSVLGTNDIFFQALPLTTAGYGYLEAFNSAGLVLGTSNNSSNTTAPIIFRPNRVEVGRITTTGNWLINTTTDNSKLTVNGSFATGYVQKAASYTATILDHTIEVTATGQTITLPTAVGITGREYVIKLTASGTATVATTSSQTIDGATTFSLSAQYKYIKVQSNGSNWVIIGNN